MFVTSYTFIRLDQQANALLLISVSQRDKKIGRPCQANTYPSKKATFCQVARAVASTLSIPQSREENCKISVSCPRTRHNERRVKARPNAFFNHTIHTFFICTVCLIMIHGEVNSIITILDLLSLVVRYFCLFFSGPLFCNDFSLRFFF